MLHCLRGLSSVGTYLSFGCCLARYADEWISNIYAPLHTRINFHVKVVHTSETRYDVDAESKKQLATLVSGGG